jgi:hypothetical protein
MRGIGARWTAVEAVFHQTRKRLGLSGREVSGGSPSRRSTAQIVERGIPSRREIS